MVYVVAYADTVEGPIQRVMREEIMEAFKHLKIGRAPRPSEVYAKVILAIGNVGNIMLIVLFQRILDGKGMPADWATCVAIPIPKEKGDIINCHIIDICENY